MIYQNVELHGIEDVTAADDRGVWLQRVPEAVRQCVNEGAQAQFLSPTCCEVRFAASGPVKITLASRGESRMCLFHGPLGPGDVRKITSEPITLELDVPAWVDKVDPERLASWPFPPHVIRLVLFDEQVRLISAQGALRPPRADELPRLRLLTYGTSITHGACATAPNLCYASQTAWRLGADLINLGVGGSCQAEGQLADYIAQRDDWDIATLALSVNMRAFDPDEYTRRLNYFVDRVAAADTSRPVACITLFPFFDDLKSSHWPTDNVMTPEFMRQVLRDAVKSAGHRNLHLIEGADILTDLSGMTPDLIHPADHAMIQMGENLARKLKKLVQR